MIKCAQCGHENLPSSTSCSKCGAPLGAGAVPGMTSAAAAAAAQIEYQRLMMARAAAAQRTRKIAMAIGVALLAGVGFLLYRDRAQKAEIAEKLAAFERFAALDKTETGPFWTCVFASEVDVGLFNNAAQVAAKIESAYATQQKSYGKYLIDDCVPKIERAQSAAGGLRDAPAELRPALDTYAQALKKLQSGLEDFAERVKSRQDVKDIDKLIQDFGAAWHSNTRPSPETIAFDKFLRCAIPDLDKLKDAQTLLEHLADQCFKKDATAFMDRVRKDCGPALTALNPKAAPAPGYNAAVKKLYEPEQRQLAAWDDCGKRSRKGKKNEDAEVFLAAFADYMKARSEVGQAARAVQEGGQ